MAFPERFQRRDLPPLQTPGGEAGRGLCSSRGRGWPCSRGSAETSGRRLPFFSPALMSVCLLRCGGYLMEKIAFSGQMWELQVQPSSL